MCNRKFLLHNYIVGRVLGAAVIVLYENVLSTMKLSIIFRSTEFCLKERTQNAWKYCEYRNPIGNHMCFFLFVLSVTAKSRQYRLRIRCVHQIRPMLLARIDLSAASWKQQKNCELKKISTKRQRKHYRGTVILMWILSLGCWFSIANACKRNARFGILFCARIRITTGKTNRCIDFSDLNFMVNWFLCVCAVLFRTIGWKKIRPAHCN